MAQLLHRRRRVADKSSRKEPFGLFQSFEHDYERQLRKVAAEIRSILAGARDESALRRASERLEKYAHLLSPWADRQALDMVLRVYESNERRWMKYAKEIGLNLKDVMRSGELSYAVAKMRTEAAEYIKSIPQKAAKRAVGLANEASFTGMRAEELEKRILQEEGVSEIQARLIARTEIARSNSMLVQARAQSLGSEAYIWQSAQDQRVRVSHAEMDGQVVYYNAPPTLDGLTGHAGCLPNCRCVQMPLLSEAEVKKAQAEQQEREERKREEQGKRQQENRREQGSTIQSQGVMLPPDPMMAGGLRANEGDTNGESRIAKKERFDIKNEQAVESAFKEFTKQTAGLELEKAIVISPDGHRYDLDGISDRVHINLLEKEILKGARVIHNHIDTYAHSFSKDDFAEFFDKELRSLEVIYNGKRHRMEWAGEGMTKLEAEKIYKDGFDAMRDEAFMISREIVEDEYETMLHLQKTLKGLRFYEL